MPRKSTLFVFEKRKSTFELGQGLVNEMNRNTHTQQHYLTLEKPASGMEVLVMLDGALSSLHMVHALQLAKTKTKTNARARRQGIQYFDFHSSSIQLRVYIVFG